MAGNATSVGAVSFDLGVNTSGLVQQINEAARNAGNQLTSAFQTAMTGCENSINGIGNSLTQMTAGMQSNLNQISQNMTDTFRNASNQIASDVQNNMSQMSQNISDSIRDSSSQLTQALNNNSNSLSDSLRNAAQGAGSLGNAAQNAAGSIGSTLTSAVKKLGAVIMSAFAVKQVISFGKACVETAAEVKALNAQFEQTFGTLQNDAAKAIQTVAKESGILETRLQSTGSQIYAFAKTSGMDSVTALNMMQEALQATADSAAYYDRSIEDTAESLRSFLKGNYANDAALGISCTETTRNAAANKLYGKSFMELSEAQKQLTLLQMVKDANALSGAMGQAAREADGWENVTGNLKEAWKQFKAVIGKPLLQSLIPIVKGITSAIQTLTSAASEATKVLADLFGWDLSEAENTGGAISNIAEDVSEAEEEAQEDIEDTAKAQKKAQNYLTGFDEMNVVKAPDEDDEGDSDKEAEKANAIEDSVNAAKNSVNDLKDSVNSLKFDGIKEQLKGVIDFFKPMADSIGGYVETSFGTAQKSITKFLSKSSGKIKEYSGKISENLTNTVTQTRNGIDNIINIANDSQEKNQEKLSDSYAELLDGATGFSLSYAYVFSDMLDTVSKNFEDWTIDDKDTIGTFFDGLNGNIANFNETLGGILGDIGTTLTDWWDNTGSQSFDNLTQAFFDVQTVILDFWNTYITPFIDYVIDSVGELWDNHLSKLWSGILEFISSLMDTVSALWNGFLRPLYDTFIKRLMTGVIGALKSVWDVIVDVFGVIVDIVRGVIRSAQGLLDFITGIFTGDLEKAATGFFEFVHGICIAIWGVIKGAINVIIDALNTVWSALYGVLKSIVDGVGDFVGAIGDLFGKNWGFSMPNDVPRIPRLAKGGLATAPTLAMVGDNKNASVDPEVIAPLSKLENMLSGGVELNQIIELLREIIAILRDLDLTVIAEVDRKVLFEVIRKVAAEYERQTGVKAF